MKLFEAYLNEPDFRPPSPRAHEGDRNKSSKLFSTRIGSEKFPNMPQSSNDPDVLRTATGIAALRVNLGPAMPGPGLRPIDKNVRNVQRPRRGYGY